MDVHLKGRCERCLMLLLYVVAMQDVKRLGVTRADDFGICDRSASDSEIIVSIGDDLMLSCLTDTEPPQNHLTWFKNNNAIRSDDRTAITENRVPCMFTGAEGNGGNCDSLQLSISNITKDEEGLYVCKGAERENGTIFVRVQDMVGETSATTLASVRTTTMTPSLTKPTCSSNITLDDVLVPSDTIAFTCMTDAYTFSAGSLDWIGMESTQMKNNNSYSTSLVMDVKTALSSDLQCILSCDEGQQNCQEDLSCTIPLFSVSPVEQEVEVGGNVSFTCEVGLKNYNVTWFVPGSHGTPIFNNELKITNRNDGRTSIFTIFNLRPDQSGTLFCTVMRNGEGVGSIRAVKFSTSPNNTDIGLAMGSTTPHPKSTGCVFLRRHDSSLPLSSPLSLTLIIIIAVCGGVALIVFVVIIIVCCRRRKEEPAMDINPVMAFGDLRDDNPVNMDVHFNVYTQHEIYDEGAISSDILRLDSTKRIPSVIRGRSNGHADRASSFIPISEDQVDVDERRKKDDDEPGRRLSYFVENDVYVTYDSNA